MSVESAKSVGSSRGSRESVESAEYREVVVSSSRGSKESKESTATVDSKPFESVVRWVGNSSFFGSSCVALHAWRVKPLR